MNEVLRILDRILKKRGYSIKRHDEFNLIPIKSFKGLSNQENAYEFFNSKNEPVKNDNTQNLYICLRTCINEKRTKGRHSQLTNVSLEDHLLTCINSLMISVNYAIQNNNNINIKVIVFDDRSDASVVDKIKKVCEQIECDWKIITTDTPGQGESLYQHFSFAKNKDALHYFCEDDYLHIPEAIHEMIAFYRKVYHITGKHLLIYPQEHEILYNQNLYPSYILLGDNRRWRTMGNATHTFFTHSKVVDDYWKYFENTKYVGVRKKRHLASERKTTDLIFNHLPGFSPIPAVAVHFQSEGCLPPFFDWQSVWKKSKL